MAATVATSQYAIATGVVFETKKDSKSTILVAPPQAQHPQLQQALQGTLLGGAPEVVSCTKFLGVNESTMHLPSMAVLRQIELQGSLSAMQVTRTAHRLGWPVGARKLYMERAQTKIRARARAWVRVRARAMVRARPRTTTMSMTMMLM